jgi:hypothetical protein
MKKAEERYAHDTGNKPLDAWLQSSAFPSLDRISPFSIDSLIQRQSEIETLRRLRGVIPDG